MTEAAPETAEVAPEASERGRYAVYPQADGGAVIARSQGLCESCAGCGCGEQADPITIPAAVMSMAKMVMEGKMRLPSMKALGAMARQSKGPARARR